jgi:hypothetical protein
MNRKQVLALVAGAAAGVAVWWLPWHWPPLQEVSRYTSPSGDWESVSFARTVPPAPILTFLGVLAVTGWAVYRLRRRT